MNETSMQILRLGTVGMFLMTMGTLIMYLNEILLKHSVNFVDNSSAIHGWCGNDLDNVITQCQSLCLLSIVDILNSCLEDLIKMRFDVMLENIIEYCYHENYGNE
eukprot:SAG22_NODE_104_length_20159_cov_5.877517_5_plen_105_part_00